MAHNEDGDRSLLAACYVVHCHVTPDRRRYPSLPEERFVSYNYPGRLAGNTMATNRHGVVWSININFPKTIVRKRKGNLGLILSRKKHVALYKKHFAMRIFKEKCKNVANCLPTKMIKM